MKIIFYGLNYAPELTGIGKYSDEMAECLVEQGHEVRVVTAPPYYPEWKVSKGYASNWYAKENINGVEVWRCPLYVPVSPSGLKRIIHLASFALSSFSVLQDYATRWLCTYNNERPNMGLGGITPMQKLAIAA